MPVRIDTAWLYGNRAMLCGRLSSLVPDAYVDNWLRVPWWIFSPGCLCLRESARDALCASVAGENGAEAPCVFLRKRHIHRDSTGATVDHPLGATRLRPGVALHAYELLTLV